MGHILVLEIRSGLRTISLESSKTSLVVLDTRFDPFTLVLPAPVGLADGGITLPIKLHGGLAKPFNGSQSCWNAFTAYSRGSGLQLKKPGI